MKRLSFITFFYLLLVSPFALAEDARAPSVIKTEQYLQNLNTAKARFLQTAHNGVQMIGTFYLERPGKLRFEYDDPIEDFVVADGFFIYFYDSELGEQSNAPIGNTLADFLLRKNIQLKDDVTVDKVERNEDLLTVKLVQTTDPAAGSITLGFEENPLKLKKWRITDAQGLITEIELFQLETGLRLEDSLFVYSNPKKFEPGNYNE
jgi:outer membrane lipoprotein-sorting protein